MKPKDPSATMKTQSTGGGGNDSEDDPIGRIPQPPKKGPTLVDASIKSNQFDEPEKHDMETSYDPPAEESTKAEQMKFDDAATQRLVQRMEKEMTRGREGSVPS